MSAYIIDNVFVSFPTKAQKAHNHDIQVIPVYFTDAASEKAVESAKEWSSQQTNKGLAIAHVRENTPMKDLTFDYIEERGLGGRAIKVFDLQGFYFDLQEDQFEQSILKYGMKPGGLLGGEWVVSRNGTQTKILLVGSEEYKEAVKYTQEKKFFKEGIKIKKADMKPGHFYKKLNSTIYYAGKMDMLFVEQKTECVGYHAETKYSIEIKKQKLYMHEDGYIDTKCANDFIVEIGPDHKEYPELIEKIKEGIADAEENYKHYCTFSTNHGHHNYLFSTVVVWYNARIVLAKDEQENQKILEEAKNNQYIKTLIK